MNDFACQDGQRYQNEIKTPDGLKWATMGTVLYYEWEMACCGSFFELGDRVEWTVSKVLPKDMDWIDENPVYIRLKPYFVTDYKYESHTSWHEDFLILDGIVRKITIICITRALSPKKPQFLEPVSGFTWNIKNSRYRDNAYIHSRLRANKYFNVDAYKVFLDDVHLRPCTLEDWERE